MKFHDDLTEHFCRKFLDKPIPDIKGFNQVDHDPFLRALFRTPYIIDNVPKDNDLTRKYSKWKTEIINN